MKKRIIAILLTVAMLVSAVPLGAFATETPSEQTSVDTGEVAIEGTNGFGTLLSQEITESQEETAEEAEDYQAGYTVTDLVIEGTTATVTYDSMEEALLVVALYTEDGMQMLTSATTTVTADATETAVEFTGEMPEYFLASAYLMDTYDLSPLCAAYDTPMYTREMQELLASTVADYDADRVLNLDDDETTNFAVYAETTKVIEAIKGVNTVASIDDENATYIIENADEQITSLVEGDVFVYPYAENEFLIVKVGTIAIDGTTVTITGSDLEMKEVFSVVKVESFGNTEEFIVDEATGTEGVEYLGNGFPESGAIGTLAEGDFEQGTVLKFGFDDVELADGVYLSGGLSSTIKLKLNYYITWSYQEVILTLDFGGEFNVKISGKCQLTPVELLRLALPVTWGLYISFNPSVIVSAETSIEYTVSLTQTVGFKYSSDSGFANLSSTPKIDTQLSISGSFFVGIDFGPELEVAGGYLLNLRASMVAGAQITGKPSGKLALDTEPDRYQHLCNTCLDGDISAKLKISPSLVFLKSEKLKVELDLCDTSIHIVHFYYSGDHQQFGWGICPYRSYQTTFQVTTREGDPVATAQITVDGLEDAFTTNSSGIASGYLPAGKYLITAASNEMYCTKSVFVEAPQKVVFPLILDRDGDGMDDDTGASGNPYDEIDFGGILGEIDSEEITDQGAVVSFGTCGVNVYWTLYSSGLLQISGSGAMKNYTSSSGQPWYNFRSQVIKIEIENGVTTIGNYAFYYCNSLTSVTIPDSITTIGNNAFNKCYSLTSVTIGDSVTTIGSYAFSFCESLTNVTIPDSVTTIGDYAFQHCNSPTSVTIGDSVTTIGGYAFSSCNSLTSVTIGDSVTTIGGYAFSSCDSLTSVTIPDSVTFIGGYAFQFCTSLTSVIIPNSVTTIGEAAYRYCSSLTSVTIGDSVTTIGGYAFSSCNSLTSVTVGDSVTTIGGYAFSSCDSLVSVTIPDSVTFIGNYTFSDCTSLTSVTIGDSVTTIGEATFYSCESLTSVTIPDSVTSIGNYVFENCYNLTSVTIGDSVTTIGCYAFSNCKSLTSATIGDSVTTIGDSAFSHCESLTSVTIPDSVTTIGEESFVTCTRMTSVTIGDSVTTIDYYAFGYCYGLTDIYYGGTEEQWTQISISLGNTYLTNATIHYNSNGATAAETPSEALSELVDASYVMSEDIPAFANAEKDKPVVSPDAVYPGDYGTEVTDTYVLKTASFACLVPSEQYILLAMKSIEVEDPLAADNLLFIDQAVALEDGTLSFQYVQRETADISYVVACGASNKNLNDAEITFPEMLADGELQVVDPTVVYDGVPLTEGRDYVIVGTVDFTEAGAYTCYIRGIHNYTGLVECTYTVGGKILVAAINLDQSSLEMAPGETAQLTATVLPEDADNKMIAWSSSDEAVAAVDENGLVTAMAEGAAEITAAATDGSGIMASCTINVDIPTTPSEPDEEALQITSQPVDYVGQLGDTATFTVTAEGEDLSYQWYFSNDNGETWQKSSTTTSTLTVEFKAYRLNYLYYCVVTDGAGNTATSDTVRLTAQEVDLVITTQPESFVGAVNDNVTFTVEASGNGLVYEWFFSSDDGETWAKSYSPGYQTNTLATILRAHRDGNLYMCIVRDVFDNYVESQAVSMSVKTSDVVIVTQPQNVENAVLNKLYTFTVEAAGDNLTYRWQVSSDGGLTWSESWNQGYNTATLSVRMNANRDGNLYRCVVTSGLKTVAISDAAILDLQDASVQILTQSGNVAVVANKTATFTVEAEGTDLTYLWYRSNDKGTTWNQTYLSGYNTNTLSFNANTNRAAMYMCKVTDGSGKSVWSEPVKLQILSAELEILTQPISITCATGETAAFTVEAQGDTLKYQWYASTDNGETWTPSYLTGYNTAKFSFVVNTARAAKLYKCVITDVAGNMVETNPVSVTIG